MSIRALCTLSLGLVVAACTVTTGEPVRDGGVNVLYSVGARAIPGKRLIALTTLDGYLTDSGGGTSSAVQLLTGITARRPIATQPVAIGAGDNGVYVIDAANNALTRFRWQGPSAGDGEGGKDRNAAGLGKAENIRLAHLSEIDEPSDLFVAPSGDLFIADSKGKKVGRYDKDGSWQQDYADADNLGRPVAVTVDLRGLRIFVADSFFDRVIAFSPKGMSLYGIGFRGEGPGGFRNIRAMVQGRDGVLYAINGVKPEIQVYGLDSTYVGSFGSGLLTEPGGMAVDDENRLFISDRFLHRILVFSNRKLVESYGRFGKQAGEFNQPGRIAFHNGHLYVLDTKNTRIQVFRVVPEKMLESVKNKDAER